MSIITEISTIIKSNRFAVRFVSITTGVAIASATTSVAGFIMSTSLFLDSNASKKDQDAIREIASSLGYYEISDDKTAKELTDKIGFALSVDDFKKVSTEIMRSTNGLVDSSQAEEIGRRLRLIEDRLDSFSNIIQDNPEKSMSIPLISQKVESLKSMLDSSTAATQQSINNIFNLFIATFGVMLTSLLGALAWFWKIASNAKNKSDSD